MGRTIIAWIENTEKILNFICMMTKQTMRQLWEAETKSPRSVIAFEMVKFSVY